MKDTFGPISETPLAFYDPDTLCWRMSQGTLAWEPPQSLEILPASGMTQNGQLYERPTFRHHINANDGFVSLPTPTARDRVKRGKKYAHISRPMHLSEAFLPTPRAQNGEARNMNIWKRPLDQPQNLENALALLPTPTARDWKGANQRNDTTCLHGAVMSRLFDVGNES